MHKPTSSDLQKIITAYFERKGYSPANLASLRDASGNTISMEQLAQYIKANHSNDNGSNRLSTISSNPVLQHLLDNDGSQDDLYGDPDAYAASYHQLREWISKALDLYKVNGKRQRTVYFCGCILRATV
jgi:transcription initiation factor TFIID subunit 5